MKTKRHNNKGVRFVQQAMMTPEQQIKQQFGNLREKAFHQVMKESEVFIKPNKNVLLIPKRQGYLMMTGILIIEKDDLHYTNPLDAFYWSIETCLARKNKKGNTRVLQMEELKDHQIAEMRESNERAIGGCGVRDGLIETKEISSLMWKVPLSYDDLKRLMGFKSITNIEKILGKLPHLKKNLDDAFGTDKKE